MPILTSERGKKYIIYIGLKTGQCCICLSIETRLISCTLGEIHTTISFQGEGLHACLEKWKLAQLTRTSAVDYS